MLDGESLTIAIFSHINPRLKTTNTTTITSTTSTTTTTTHNNNNNNNNNNTSPHDMPMQANRGGGGGIALTHSHIDARRRWVDRTTARPLYRQERPRHPLYKRLTGPHGRSGRVRKISRPPGFNPRTVHRLVCRSTD